MLLPLPSRQRRRGSGAASPPPGSSSGANHCVCTTPSDDPRVPGVTCHVSQARTRWEWLADFGLAEDPAVLLACRQVRADHPTRQASRTKSFSEGTPLHPLQNKITRFHDTRRNVLVYLAISARSSRRTGQRHLDRHLAALGRQMGSAGSVIRHRGTPTSAAN